MQYVANRIQRPILQLQIRIITNCREMGLLNLPNLEICIKKAEFSEFKGKKSEFKGQIVSKSDLINAYNPIYFDRNISENRDDKKWGQLM